MIKQLIINNKKSFDDFDVYIGGRTISNPKKKSIKESIPFSDIVYDFSKLDGDIHWEERTLQYEFDIAEISTDLMEVAKTKLVDWLLNVHDTDIYDPYIGDYHYHGSYDSDSWSENFEAGTIKVKFSVYPFKIANEPRVETFNLTSGNNSISILNNSSHRIVPKITSTGSATITIGDNVYSMGTGEYEDDDLKLEQGSNEWVVNVSSDSTLTIEFVEEVF